MSQLRDHYPDAPSRAAVRGHPIHPALIPFPIAFLTAAFLTDLGWVWTDDPFWARAALWLTGTGVVSGAAAAVFGLVDFLTVDRARRPVGRVHAIAAGSTLALATGSWLVRAGDPVAAVLPWGLILSAATLAAVGLTGWAGGELAYRHLVGVTGPPAGGGRAAAARRPVRSPAGSDPAGEPDLAGEHSGATFADQLRGGPEGVPEPESPNGYAGMDQDRRR